MALFGANRLERELDDEVRAHLELAEHDALARGLDPAEARREALRQFGGIDQMKEVHRDDRSVRWIENLIKDARYGLAGAAARTLDSRSSPSACSRSASAPTPRCSASSTACSSSRCRFPIPSASSASGRRRRRPRSNSTTTRHVSRVEAPDAIVRGAVGGIAVDGDGAGQRRADQAERPLRVRGITSPSSACSR